MTKYVYTYDKVVGISFGIFASFSNIIALIVLFKCKEMVSQIKIFAMNLAISDFLMGMFWVVSLLFIGPLVGELTTTYYMIFFYVLSCIGIVSVLSICCLALDRLLVCFLPMRYPFWITSCKAIVCNIVVWIVGTLFSLFTFQQASKSQINGVQMWLRDRFALTVGCFSYTIFFLFMATAYGLIMRNAKRTANRVIPRHLNANGNLTSFLHFFNSSFVILRVSILVIFSQLCIFLILLTALSSDLTDNQISNMHKATCGFCIITSMLNPVLYIWRFKEFQKHFLTMFCYWNPKMRSLTVAMVSKRASERAGGAEPKTMSGSESSTQTDSSFTGVDEDDCSFTSECAWTASVAAVGNDTVFDSTCTPKEPKVCNIAPERSHFSEGNNVDREERPTIKQIC